MNYLLLGLTCFLWSYTVVAQPATKNILNLDSEVFGKKRTLLVYTPPNYTQDKEKKYQVLYVFGEEVEVLADLVASSASYLSKKNRLGTTRSQDFIVVGVQVENPYVEFLPKRTKKVEVAELNPYRLEGQVGMLDQHLEKEVFPFIKNNYQTFPYHIVLGEGLGATYALYDCAKQQSLFQSFIAVDPNLMYYEEAIVEQLNKKIEQQKAAFYLYLAADTQDFLSTNTVDGIKKLEQTLKGAGNSAVQYEVYYKDDSKASPLFITSVGASIQSYKKTVGAPSKEWLDSASNSLNFTQQVKDYYQKRDQWLGYTQPASIDELVLIAEQVEYEKGIELLDWGTELYPKSYFLHKRQADLAQQEKKYKAAVQYYEKGLVVLEQQKQSLHPRAYETVYQLFQKAQLIASAKQELEDKK